MNIYIYIYINLETHWLYSEAITLEEDRSTARSSWCSKWRLVWRFWEANWEAISSGGRWWLGWWWWEKWVWSKGGGGGGWGGNGRFHPLGLFVGVGIVVSVTFFTAIFLSSAPYSFPFCFHPLSDLIRIGLGTNRYMDESAGQSLDLGPGYRLGMDWALGWTMAWPVTSPSATGGPVSVARDDRWQRCALVPVQGPSSSRRPLLMMLWTLWVQSRSRAQTAVTTRSSSSSPPRPCPSEDKAKLDGSRWRMNEIGGGPSVDLLICGWIWRWRENTQ